MKINFKENPQILFVYTFQAMFSFSMTRKHSSKISNSLACLDLCCIHYQLICSTLAYVKMAIKTMFTTENTKNTYSHCTSHFTFSVNVIFAL